MKITIITINLNNRKGLERTIDSVVNQTCSCIEYIVIDGGSADGSAEVIKRRAAHLSYWVSEPDNGLYHAMNKGILKATGDYLLFLNSGDYLKDRHVIQQAVSEIGNEDLVYGNIGICDAKGRIRELPSSPAIVFHERYQHNLPPQAAIFFKKDLFRRTGLFDEQYRIISDVALISKAFYSDKTTYKYIDMPVTVFDTTGMSSSSSNRELIYRERRSFLQQEYPQYLKDFEMIYSKGGLRKRLSGLIRLFMNSGNGAQKKDKR